MNVADRSSTERNPCQQPARSGRSGAWIWACVTRRDKRRAEQIAASALGPESFVAFWAAPCAFLWLVGS